MCKFISWKEKDGDVFFLTDDDLTLKKLKEFKEYNYEWRRDICGHGAIDWFYPKLEGVGILGECTDFSTPDNFPKEIVKAIKSMKMTKIGIGAGLLNKSGVTEYNKIYQSAEADYNKIQTPALADYNKIQQSALAEYYKIQQSAYEKYQKIEQSAYDDYNKIQQSALAEYYKIQQSAYEKYQKIEQSAYDEYKKIKQPAYEKYYKIKLSAFWKTFKQKKYRNPEWE